MANLSVSQLCGRFLLERSRRCRPRTLVAYEAQARLRIVPSLGHLRVDDVTHSHALDAHADWCGRAGPSAGNHSKRIALSIWTHGLRWQLAEGGNPWHGIRNHEERRRRNPVTSAQAVLVRACCEGILAGESGPISPVYSGLFLVTLATGLRVSNVTHLQWTEVDLDAGEIRIRRHKGRGDLVVPLNSYAKHLLGTLPRWHGQWVCPSLLSASGHVEEYWRAWDRLRTHLGLRDVTVHDIRRGFAQAAWDSGATDKDVQLLLGHQSVSTTQRHYIRYSKVRAERSSEATAVALGLQCELFDGGVR